jgi:hypothetical protein
LGIGSAHRLCKKLSCANPETSGGRFRSRFQISKIAMVGHRPVNFAWSAGPMVASPDGGAEWRFRFQMTLLYPR